MGEVASECWWLRSLLRVIGGLRSKRSNLERRFGLRHQLIPVFVERLRSPSEGCGHRAFTGSLRCRHAWFPVFADNHGPPAVVLYFDELSTSEGRQGAEMARYAPAVWPWKGLTFGYGLELLVCVRTWIPPRVHGAPRR